MTGLAFVRSYGGAGHGSSPWWLALSALGVVLIVNLGRWLRRRNRRWAATGPRDDWAHAGACWLYRLVTQTWKTVRQLPL